MSSPRTYTYTWTQTRLESIQDQFRYLLMYADIAESHIDKVVSAIGEKAIQSIGAYGCDSSNLRVVEVELSVDWSDHARLTLEAPTIVSGLPGWKDRESPEVRVAGRRFADTVKEQNLTSGWWIELTEQVKMDKRRTDYWNKRLAIGGNVPGWKGSGFAERREQLLDVVESNIFLRQYRD